MNGATWCDRRELDQWLRDQGRPEFADQVRRLTSNRLNQPTNGDLRQWIATLDKLPSPDKHALDLSDDRICVTGPEELEPTSVRELLMRFHPWRKGPLQFLSHQIDTEWRSDWKYERFRNRVDFRDKKILDVGCGNGYFGWRMIADGASFVLGLDPILRFIAQFEVFNRYSATPRRHHLVPLIDEDLPSKLSLFDIVLSAGVLYHRTSPVDHLRSLSESLVKGGQLVLETLIVEDDSPTVLVPEDRYAQMRNVWFLPSVSMIKRWLRRTGFANERLVDVTATTSDEQRSTEWMTFQSLPDFLDPDDPTKTVEGYPAPGASHCHG